MNSGVLSLISLMSISIFAENIQKRKKKKLSDVKSVFVGLCLTYDSMLLLEDVTLLLSE